MASSIDPELLKDLLPRSDALDDTEYKTMLTQASSEEQMQEALLREEMDRHLKSLYSECFTDRHLDLAGLLMEQYQVTLSTAVGDEQFTPAALSAIPWAKALIAMQLIQLTAQSVVDEKSRDALGSIRYKGMEMIALNYQACRAGVETMLTQLMEASEAARSVAQAARSTGDDGEGAYPEEEFRRLNEQVAANEARMTDILRELEALRAGDERAFPLAVQYTTLKTQTASLLNDPILQNPDRLWIRQWLSQNFTPALRTVASRVLREAAPPELSPWANAVDALAAFQQPHSLDMLRGTLEAVATQALLHHDVLEPRLRKVAKMKLSAAMTQSKALGLIRAWTDVDAEQWETVAMCVGPDAEQLASNPPAELAGRLEGWGQAVSLLAQFSREILRHAECADDEREKHAPLLARLMDTCGVQDPAAAVEQHQREGSESAAVRCVPPPAPLSDAVADPPAACAENSPLPSEDTLLRGFTACADHASVALAESVLQRSQSSVGLDKLHAWATAVTNAMARHCTAPADIVDVIKDFEAGAPSEVESYAKHSCAPHPSALRQLAAAQGWDPATIDTVATALRCKISMDNLPTNQVEWAFAVHEMLSALSRLEGSMRCAVDEHAKHHETIHALLTAEAVQATPKFGVCLAARVDQEPVTQVPQNDERSSVGPTSSQGGGAALCEGAPSDDESLGAATSSPAPGPAPGPCSSSDREEHGEDDSAAAASECAEAPPAEEAVQAAPPPIAEPAPVNVVEGAGDAGIVPAASVTAHDAKPKKKKKKKKKKRRQSDAGDDEGDGGSTSASDDGARGQHDGEGKRKKKKKKRAPSTDTANTSAAEARDEAGTGGPLLTADAGGAAGATPAVSCGGDGTMPSAGAGARKGGGEARADGGVAPAAPQPPPPRRFSDARDGAGALGERRGSAGQFVRRVSSERRGSGGQEGAAAATASPSARLGSMDGAPPARHPTAEQTEREEPRTRTFMVQPAPAPERAPKPPQEPVVMDADATTRLVHVRPAPAPAPRTMTEAVRQNPNLARGIIFVKPAASD